MTHFVERLLPPDLSQEAAVALEDFIEFRNEIGNPVKCRWLTAFTFYLRAIASYQYYRLFDYLNGVPIRSGISDLPVHFTPNGGAVPGDRIVGILSPGEGITIYPIQSPELKQFEDEPERWLDARWNVDDKVPQRFPAQLAVLALNEPKTFTQIIQVIAKHDGDIHNIRFARQSPDFAELTVDLAVYNLTQLNSIIFQLRANKFVPNAERVNG